MTATVIPLDSRRRRDHKAPDCCPRHQVEALLVRVQETVRAHETELLIPAEVVTAMAADVLATVTRALTDPTTERTSR